MSKNKDYKSQLETRRALLMGRVSALEEYPLNQLSADERKILDDAQYELRGIETQIAKISEPDFNLPGTGREIKRWKNDDRIEGRKNEVLDSRQSMNTWLERRGIAKHEGTDRDFNRYWGEKFGFARPTIESRALAEDTSSGAGAAQAIVPQVWTAQFIDYLYPHTMLGQAGMSRFVMESEKVNKPQLTNVPQPAWIAENASTSLDGTPAFSSLVFSAAGMFYDILLISYELAQDAYIDGTLNQVLFDAASKMFGITVDKAGLYGVSGNAGNPGLNNETGFVLRKYAGHNVSTGATPADFSEISILREMARNANADVNAILCAPQYVGTMSRLNASTYAKYWEPPSDVQDLWPPIYSTTIPVVETDPGTSTPSLPAQTGGSYTSIYGGYFPLMMMGTRLDLTTQVLRERFIDQNQIGLWMGMRFSIRTAHPEVFTRSYGITTT